MRRRGSKKRLRFSIGRKFRILQEIGIAAAVVIGMNFNYLGFPVNFAAFRYFYALLSTVMPSPETSRNPDRGF